jgi:anti-sigma factor ChrR (cupin superfamily)
MQYEEFCELAALYALDTLSQSERDLVAEAIAKFPEWEAELAAMQATVANLGYTAADAELPKGLKQRLFQQIAADASDTTTLMQQAATVSWQPDSIPGVMVGQMYVDLVKREIACFLRCAAGVVFPNHKHGGNEEIVILEGDLIIDGKIYASGERICCALGTVHQPKTQNGCLVFLRTSLDNEIIN